MRIGCIIMASGTGVRFGENKLLATLGSKPLIEWVSDATEIFEHRVTVTRHKEIEAFCKERGIRCILHSLPDRSDTVRLGIEAIGEVDGVIFFPADQPLVTQETLAGMVSAADGEHIVRLSFDGVLASPTLFPKKYFDELSLLPVGKGGGYLLSKYPDMIRAVNAKSPVELCDVDTKADLQRLAEYLQK